MLQIFAPYKDLDVKLSRLGLIQGYEEFKDTS
ncbi:hypothetical protein KN1_16500 [Stygiolobus caldivivus]|uniref:Uncharacterized protein n=1 Tax=Stygiolobus caldivivus TaxID=2824673 RepID=A0A8D5U6S8_9CREN|nr:hypothetical protein KN1_16500 [Stygiolobus caldivivus]